MNNLTAGEKAPEIVNVVIEVPLDSRAKYELDHDLNMIVVDRFLFFDRGYPANYGFIPNTALQRVLICVILQ